MGIEYVVRSSSCGLLLHPPMLLPIRHAIVLPVTTADHHRRCIVTSVARGQNLAPARSALWPGRHLPRVWASARPPFVVRTPRRDRRA